MNSIAKRVLVGVLGGLITLVGVNGFLVRIYSIITLLYRSLC